MNESRTVVSRQATRRAAGFTLIEIMVVVIVLAVLAGLVVPQFTSVTKDAKVSTAKTNLKSLQSALLAYHTQNDIYPTTEEGLEKLISEDLPELPLDPWGCNFQYQCPGESGKPYDIWSLGADKKPGGSGIDADISVWRTKGSED